MRILITGASGQIGTNLALRLLEHGDEVYGVDKRVNTWTNRFPCVLQDLGAPNTASESGIGGVEYPRPDIVVHLAAHAKVHQLVRMPHRALENIVMTYNVLEYCRLARVPVIYSSSREVYGDIHRFSTEEGKADFAYTESTYSASKIAGEALIYSYSRCYNLPYIVFRFSNVYGKCDNDLERMERVIPLFMKKIIRDDPIVIYGPEKILDFTYVDDCVDGILAGIRALISGKVKNETINLAYGRGNTLLRVAELLGQATNRTPQITTAPPLLGEVTRYVADISKARALLGYEPKVPLEQGIARSVKWATEWAQEHGRTLAEAYSPSYESATAEGVGFKKP